MTHGPTNLSYRLPRETAVPIARTRCAIDGAPFAPLAHGKGQRSLSQGRLPDGSPLDDEGFATP